MNSMSRPVDHSDKSCGCKKEKEKEASVLLKCKTGFPLTITEDVTTGTAFTLNTLSLNLEKFKNPCVKFEFAANIVSATTTATLSFRIFKQCRNQTTPTPIGPEWVYDVVALTGTDAFTFIVCDCECDNDSCYDECCTYTVVVTAVSTEVGTTIINNPTFSALVVDNNCH
ncbi:DUF4489 domain-containing protein [Clostridium sp.]|jgi:hypothetical protein|uniref:DUF4489 domain-containing protein n=1 Tax=Clostridium sp. TaxID=1506 RepID=UPI003EF081F7